MDNKLEKIKNKIKHDKIFIFIMIFSVAIMVCTNIVNIITYSQKDSTKFEVKLVEEGEEEGNYCLFIEDENYGKIDYNEYSAIDENGNRNEKLVLIIDKITEIINLVMMGIIFYISYFVIKSVVDEGKPFKKENINRMRLIALMIILIAVIPSIIKLISTFIVFSKATLYLGSLYGLIIMLGVIFGVISELFKYGYELQEDIDMIA